MQKNKPEYSHKYNGKNIEFRAIEDALCVKTYPTTDKGISFIKTLRVDGIEGIHKNFTVPEENIQIYKVVKHKREKLIETLSSYYGVENVNKVYVSGTDIFYGTGKLILIPKVKMSDRAIEKKCEGIVVDKFKGVYLIDYLNDTIADIKCGELTNESWIEHVEKNFYTDQQIPDHPLRVCDHPDTTIPLPKQKAYDITQTFEAHKKFEGNPDIKIAILDSGVDINHPDLKSQTIKKACWDFIRDSTHQIPLRVDAHGTLCAGLAVAKKNSSIGVDGVGKGCSLISYRIGMNDYSIPVQFRVNIYLTIKAILKAGLNAKADVINCSWSLNQPFKTMEYAIKKVSKTISNPKGSIIVCSAGNNGSKVKFPGSLKSVITVSSVTENKIPLHSGNSNTPSNYGKNVDIAAPGINLVTTDILCSYGISGSIHNNHNYYTQFGATSGAAPQVAGCVALMLSVNPSLKFSKIKKILKKTATEFSEKQDHHYGAGVLNVLNAVEEAKKRNL
ncbi:S8 family serine peptidase [Aquimarina sp. AU58]|uniref:S8 family peptidase n=1 Tax=Aquimarina sp. AU58 TaxID=1874112 RepID=UPI000D65B7EA|nr:S8 family serine peptidase [Aquimarina sp. AU58]